MKIYRRSLILFLMLLLALSAGCATRQVADQKDAAPAAPQTGVQASTVPEPSPAKGAAAPAPQQAVPVSPDKAVRPAPPEILPPPAPAVNRNAVGCVLPLSGRFAEAGSRALDAVLLAADSLREGSKLPWKIVVADSGDTVEQTREAVRYLADEANVIAMVAIAGSAEAIEAAQEAQKRKTPLILITSREGVTQAGEYVFQHFLTPSQQVEALSSYAVNRLNVAIFSILYPQDDYGEEMIRLFQASLKEVGGKVDKAIPYDKTQTDFTEQIKKLAGNRFGATGKVFATATEARDKKTLEFEALFIPDSALRVKMIASQLAFYDIKGMRLLGTSLWHTPDLIRKGADYLEGAIFADCFLVNGMLPETNDFVDIYYSAYTREPDSMEALAYDTMSIALKILDNEAVKTREEFIFSLLTVSGYRGATGSITFRGSRVAQKDAFILKIFKGKIEQVK